MFDQVSSFMCVLRGILEALPHYDSTYLLLIVLVYFYSFIYKHDTLFVSLKPEYQRLSIFLLLSLAAPACAPYTLQQPYYFLIQLIILISFILHGLNDVSRLYAIFSILLYLAGSRCEAQVDAN